MFFILRALHVLKSSRTLCLRVASFFLALGEEGAGLCTSRAFVCLFCTCKFLSFFSSSWGRGLAAVVIVALPGLFYKLFCHCDMNLRGFDFHSLGLFLPFAGSRFPRFAHRLFFQTFWV